MSNRAGIPAYEYEYEYADSRFRAPTPKPYPQQQQQQQQPLSPPEPYSAPTRSSTTSNAKNRETDTEETKPNTNDNHDETGSGSHSHGHIHQSSGENSFIDPVADARRTHRDWLRRTGVANASTVFPAINNDNNNATAATTLAFAPSRFGFIAGFRNQIMALTILVMQAAEDGHLGLLLDSLWHKDTYGTETCDPFDFYFDVAHWNKVASSMSSNSNSNRLPAMVMWDPDLHDQWDPSTARYVKGVTADTATRPYGYGKGSTRLASRYQVYARGKGKFASAVSTSKSASTSTSSSSSSPRPRHPLEIAMLRGALRPHPDLAAVVERCKTTLRRTAEVARQRRGLGATTESSQGSGAPPPLRYMTLHARVEPDATLTCGDKKVRLLREIVAMVEARWPGPEPPPFDAVFLPINRQKLEEEGQKRVPGDTNSNTDPDPTADFHRTAVDNLRFLNRLTGRHDDNSDNAKDNADANADADAHPPGMWNGTVPVVEFGSEALEGSVYKHRPSLSGSILNFELAIGADVFVGTEISSFSHDLLAARFYRATDTDTDAAGGGSNANTNVNFKYLPGMGLREWITPGMVGPLMRNETKRNETKRNETDFFQFCLIR
eukprot:jgi/Psemu1/185454/e_gw1.49.61.1